MHLLPLLALALARPAVALDAVDSQAILQIEAQRLPPLALATYASSDDAETRARATRALGRLRTAAALAPLRGLAEDPDRTVRLEAAFALGQSPGSERVVLERLPQEPDPAVRAALCEALGKEGSEAAVPVLLASLYVRPLGLARPVEAEAASVALGRLSMRRVEQARTSEVVAALLDQLARFDRDTRRGAAFAVGRIGPEQLPDAIAARVLEAAGDDADQVVRAFLLRAVGTLGLSGALANDREAVLAGSIRDADVGVRVAALRAGARVGWPGVVALLSDPDAGVRREAISAVGAVDGIDHAAVLVPIIEAGDSTEASEAWRATGDSRVNEAADALTALATAAGRLRQAAEADPTAELPSWATSPDVAAPWLPVEKDTWLRVAAAGVSTDTIALVELATKDGEPPVRTAAAWRVTELGPTAQQVDALLGAFDAIVQAIAIEHLADHPNLASERPVLAALGDAEEIDLLVAGAHFLSLVYPGARPIVRKPAPEARAIVERLAAHSDPRVREAAAPAAQALGLTLPNGWHHLVGLPLDEVLSMRSARLVTSRGEAIIELLPDEAPITVWNFALLADDHYFDGLRVHRVVPDFVVQDGDPRGDGNGGPGWSIPDEINPISYREGVVGMALSGPDTGGSQWFVTLSPQPHLDGTYTVFGRVVSGMHVLQQVQPGDRIVRIVVERSPPPEGS